MALSAKTTIQRHFLSCREIKDTTNSFAGGMVFCAGLTITGILLVFMIRSLNQESSGDISGLTFIARATRFPETAVP